MMHFSFLSDLGQDSATTLVLEWENELKLKRPPKVRLVIAFLNCKLHSQLFNRFKHIEVALYHINALVGLGNKSGKITLVKLDGMAN